MNTHSNVARTVALTGVTAAAYAAITLATPWMAYREVQFRIAEMLNLLVFFDPIFAPGVVLGCAIANLFSPFGMVDVLVGSCATALALFAIRHTKRLFAAALWPVAANGVLIPLEIMAVDKIPFTAFNFLPIAASVAVGEFVVCAVVGYTVFRLILKRDGAFFQKLSRRFRGGV